MIIGNIVLVLAFLATAGILGYGYQKFGKIPRVQISDVLTGDTEVGSTSEAQNFLLVGVDSAENLDPDDPVRSSRSAIGGLRSDTVMVLRVDPASSRAALLSLPRDLYLPIAGTRGSDRINTAVQIGGAEGLIETIQSYFGIPINHYVQVDFFGFSQIVDAIGGVPIYFPNPVRDTHSGLSVPESGCATLDASNALGFVRSRYYQEQVNGRWKYDPTGDIGRVRRQQEFIISALHRAFEQGLRNPVTVDDLINGAIDAVTVDDALTGQDVLDLATEFRKFDPSSLDVYQLPVSDDNVGGAAVLRLQARSAEPILEIFRNRDPSAVSESDVRVEVRNGTGAPGEASEVAAGLRDVGFAISGTGDAATLGGPRTEVVVPPGAEAQGDLVARWLVNGARVVTDPDAEGIVVTTGADFVGIRSTPEPAPASATSTTQLQSTTTTTPVNGASPSSSTTVFGTIPTEIPADVSCG